jgi:hypothetical protein
VIHVVRVSGTIRKSEEAAIRLARLSIKRAQMQADGGKALIAQDTTSRPGTSMQGGDLSIQDWSGFEDGIEDADKPGEVDDGDD